MPTIIPSSDHGKILTEDSDGITVSILGSEETSIDQGTGEVCRRRPVIAKMLIPTVPQQVLADILIHQLGKAGGDKDAEMAHSLLVRAKAHLDKNIARTARLAARACW